MKKALHTICSKLNFWISTQNVLLPYLPWCVNGNATLPLAQKINSGILFESFLPFTQNRKFHCFYLQTVPRIWLLFPLLPLWASQHQPSDYSSMLTIHWAFAAVSPAPTHTHSFLYPTPVAVSLLKLNHSIFCLKASNIFPSDYR